MKYIFPFVLLFSSLTHATELKECGEPGTPEYFAAVFGIFAQMETGEGFMRSACKNGSEMDCSQAAIKRFGIKCMQDALRAYYPPASESEGCQALHKACENECMKYNLFTLKECRKGCN